MQLYPRSLDLAWPGHLLGTGCLSARAMDSGFPTGVWCLCLGLGCTETPPFLAGVQGVCAWTRVSALPRHSWLGFVVRAFGVAFCSDAAMPRWGLGCVCLFMRFGCAPPFLAGVCGLCIWVSVFRAPCYFWLGCWGVCSFARAPSVPLHPLVGLPVVWGRVGVALGGVSPPPSYFFLGLAAGGGFCGFGSPPCRVVALLWSPSPVSVLGPLVSAPLPPFVWVSSFFFLCPCGRWPATSPVGCVPACPGCPFLQPFGGRVAVVGRCFWLGVTRLGGVVPRCSIWGARESRFWCLLAWVGCLLLVEWVCGFAVVCLPPLLSFFPVGWRVCIRGWVAVLFVCGGGFACSSLCLPWAGARTGRHTVWLSGSLLVSWVSSGRPPAPWVGWAMYTLGLMACPVGSCAGSACWAVAPAGFVRSWVRGGGFAPCLPAPAVPVSWSRF